MEMLQRWVRRHRVLTAVITGGLTLIALGTAATFWQKQKAESALQILAGTMSDTQYGSIYYLNQEKMIESLDRAASIADSLTEENQMHLFTGLSRAYHDLHQWDRALASLEKAEALTQKLKLAANILRRHQEAHILVLLALKRGQEALALTEKLLPDYEAKLLPDDPDRIFLLTLHAKALRVAGRPKEAVAAYESLFERLKNWPDEVHPIDILNAHLSYPIALRQAGEQEVATKLGIAEGQNSRTPETLLNWLTSLRDTLQGQHLGREQALEAYGFKVTIGTAAGRKTKAAKPQ